MKANVKSAGAFTSLLLNHGEKLGMLIVLAGAGWLVYGAMSPEKETRKPGELSTLVTNTKNQVTSFTMSDAPPIEEDPENGPLTPDMWQATAATEIDPDVYATRDPWGAPIVPKTVLRTDPLLLAAESLEGFGSTTLIATQDPETQRRREEERLREEREREFERQRERERTADARDRRDRGDRRGAGPEDDRRSVNSSRRRQMGVAVTDDDRIDLVSFAAVTALVPVKDQWMQYRDTLQNATGYSPQRDVPQWLGYYVERTEVAADAEADWKPVLVPDRTARSRTYPFASGVTIERATADWLRGMEPMMDKRYYHPNLTYPLPPLAGKNFGREVVHSQVPLQVETDAAQAKLAAEPEADLPDGEESLLGPGGDTRNGLGGSQFGAMGDEFGDYGGGYDGGVDGDYGGGYRGGAGGALGGEFSFSEPYVMLRFFDFTVEPGKRYRYRVRLMLQDVNAKDLVNINYLDKEVKQRVAEQEVDGKPKPRLSDWSEPSRIISIPSAGDVLVAGVKPAPSRSPNGEPTADLLIKSYEVTENHRARQAEKIMTFRRGAVLNRTEEDIWVMSESGRRELVKLESFTFRTNATLLDIRGGQKLGRDAAMPGSVIYMGASGELFVSNEVSSLEDVEIHREIYEESEDDKGRRDQGGFDEGYGDFDMEF